MRTENVMPGKTPPFEMHGAVQRGVFTIRWPRLRVTREQLVISAARIPIVRVMRGDVESLVFRRARRPLSIDSMKILRKARDRAVHFYLYPATTNAAFAAIAELGWPCVWEEARDAV
jgi:hypothetical protein